MVDGRSTSGSVPLRRLTAGILGAVLVGALVAPAAALAIEVAGNADLITTTEDHAAVTGNVLTNDTGIVRSSGYHISNGAPGTLTVASNGDYEFTPAAGWSGDNTLVGWYYADPDMLDNGNDILTYVRVTVTAVNDAPVATAQTLQTDEDTDLPITLAGTDVELSALTFSIVSQPAHGSLDGSGASQTYTPDPDYNGPDSFTFKANDGTDDSAPATVDITVVPVPDLPTAADQSVNVVFETATPITLTGEDVDGDTLAFTVLTQPAHGELTGTAPALTYTPADGFHGADSFTFKVVANSDDSNTATVSITVADDVVAPTVPAPTIGFGATTTTTRIKTTAPLTIHWSATDAGSGVASYVVENKVGTGAWTQIYAGTDTSITKSYAFNVGLTWRVKAVDNKGNWSTFTVSALRKLAAYSGSSPVVTSGTWTRVTSTASVGGTYYYSTASGKYKSLSFNGIGVLFVAPRTSVGGKVIVRIDGSSYALSTYKSGASQYGAVIKGKTLTGGAHTIRVTNNQAGHRANFDAFIVLR